MKWIILIEVIFEIISIITCLELNVDCKSNLECQITACCKKKKCEPTDKCENDSHIIYIVVGVIGLAIITIVIVHFVFTIRATKRNVINLQQENFERYNRQKLKKEKEKEREKDSEETNDRLIKNK